MAFSIPAGVSTIRGGAWPSRSARNRPLTATPPRLARSTMSLYSTPYPKHPLAAMSGFGSVSVPMATERSMSMRERVPDDPGRVEDRPLDAGAQVMRSAAAVAGENDAAVAAAETAAHNLFERD